MPDVPPADDRAEEVGGADFRQLELVQVMASRARHRSDPERSELGAVHEIRGNSWGEGTCSPSHISDRTSETKRGVLQKTDLAQQV